MIYPGIRVLLPDMGGCIFKRGKVNYLYVGERQSTETEGKTTHPKSKCIGRVEFDDENRLHLMPNIYYYELMGLSQPDIAVMEGAGRKPWKEKPEPAEKREGSAEIAVGYCLAVMLLSAELQLTQILKDTFGETLGKRILSLTAFMCERAHSSLDGLDQFIGTHLAGINLDMAFDRRAAAQVLVDITPEQCGNFYTRWNILQEERFFTMLPHFLHTQGANSVVCNTAVLQMIALLMRTGKSNEIKSCVSKMCKIKRRTLSL